MEKVKTLDPFRSGSKLKEAMSIPGSKMIRTREGTEISVPIVREKRFISSEFCASAESAAEKILRLAKQFNLLPLPK